MQQADDVEEEDIVVKVVQVEAEDEVLSKVNIGSFITSKKATRVVFNATIVKSMGM